ncbi:methyltransferase [Nocardiopsis sp. CNT-189]
MGSEAPVNRNPPEQSRPGGPGAEDPRDGLMRLLVGPWLFGAVGAAVRLGVPDLLAEGPRTARELAAKVQADAESLHRLLRVLAAAGVLEEDGRGAPGAFALTGQGALLRRDAPGSLRPLVLLYSERYFADAWERLAEAVRTGDQAFELAHGTGVFDYLAARPEEAARYTEGIAAGSAFLSEVSGAFAFPDKARVVDVGGGDGGLLASVLRAHPAATGVLLELPAAAAEAREALSDLVGQGRCEVAVGDFTEAVPERGDAYLLCRVLHNWDDEACRALLSRCARAMAGGGAVLILERVLPDHGHPPLSLAFDLHMMVMTGGRERTLAEYRRLLAAAGLRLEEARGLASEMSLLVARAG